MLYEKNSYFKSLFQNMTVVIKLNTVANFKIQGFSKKESPNLILEHRHLRLNLFYIANYKVFLQTKVNLLNMTTFGSPAYVCTAVKFVLSVSIVTLLFVTFGCTWYNSKK